MFQRVKEYLSRLGSEEPAILVFLLIVSSGTWIFLGIAEAVTAGWTEQFDVSVVRNLRRAETPEQPIGPEWLTEVGRDITALGGYFMLAFWTFSVAGLLAMLRKHRMMLLVLAATVGGYLMMMMLKELFARPRPDVVPHLSLVYSNSFPSGHSAMSAIVYLTLGTLLARVVKAKRVKVYIMTLAVVLTLLVGCSRVYLGVHYPTDVLAGWTLGCVWAACCLLVERWLEVRGTLGIVTLPDNSIMPSNSPQ